MNSCKTIKKFEGENKSTKIVEMINYKIRKELRTKLPEIRNNKKLVSAYTKFLKLKKEKQKAREELEKIKNELGLVWTYTREGADRRPVYDYDIDVSCRVPTKTMEKLQNAQNLFTLGKVKEAQKEWESVITEWQLTK